MTDTNAAVDERSITTPAGYVGWSAAQKHEWVWETLLCGHEHHPVDRPDLEMAGAWTMLTIAGRRSQLQKTLDHDGDCMPTGRPKIIHTRGVAAMVEFVPDASSPFTGILGPVPSGGATGVCRMSLAVPPSGARSFTPGMGLKFFVDGAPSLDTLAMNHTVGQGRDINVFANTFTHDLTGEHEELRVPQKVMSVAFRRVSSNPRRLSIAHFAEWCADGSRPDLPHVPDRLVFRPHREVVEHYNASWDDDVRDPIIALPSGIGLYTVEAANAADGAPLPIGELRTTTRFVSSPGADRLFFRHHVVEDDRVH